MKKEAGITTAILSESLRSRKLTNCFSLAMPMRGARTGKAASFTHQDGDNAQILGTSATNRSRLIKKADTGTLGRFGIGTIDAVQQVSGIRWVLGNCSGKDKSE